MVRARGPGDLQTGEPRCRHLGDHRRADGAEGDARRVPDERHGHRLHRRKPCRHQKGRRQRHRRPEPRRPLHEEREEPGHQEGQDPGIRSEGGQRPTQDLGASGPELKLVDAQRRADDPEDGEGGEAGFHRRPPQGRHGRKLGRPRAGKAEVPEAHRQRHRHPHGARLPRGPPEPHHQDQDGRDGKPRQDRRHPSRAVTGGAASASGSPNRVTGGAASAPGSPCGGSPLPPGRRWRWPGWSRRCCPGHPG